MVQRKGEYFTISVVSKMYDIHPQTLRLYEREGLLIPHRSEGNHRLYSREDLQKLSLILSLTRELGVNLAGVDVILSMREKMQLLQRQVEELRRFVRDTMGKDPSNVLLSGEERSGSSSSFPSRAMRARDNQ
ncbi:MAG: MerR family transcriptional regulator [Nitrospinota bacterium]|nr:MAG: MerR family transcriptional regulator [Nitrospinota bacterium]